MKNLNQFKLLFKDKEIIMMLPFWSCDDAINHIVSCFGMQPKSRCKQSNWYGISRITNNKI